MIHQLKTWLALAGLAFLLSGCGPEQTNLDGKTMGTYYSVKYMPGEIKINPEEIQKGIDKHLLDVNQQMSTYMPDSELSRFNHSREINVPFKVSHGVTKVIQEAIRINHLTEGGLDITVGPLVNLWGFGPEGRPDRIPDKEELEKRRAWTGIEKLRVQNGALIKDIPELYIDLSSIAKGYGVDVVAEYLESQHIENYMVDIGGEVRTRGKNGQDRPWRIAIEKPSAGLEQSVQEIIEPGNMAIATSGDYRNYFEENGVRYSHTIDPKTGEPIKHNLASITVIAVSCMTADGLSTGLGVMGPEKGMALANQLNIPVFMIVKTEQGFEERYSDAFKAYMTTNK